MEFIYIYFSSAERLSDKTFYVADKKHFTLTHLCILKTLRVLTRARVFPQCGHLILKGFLYCSPIVKDLEWIEHWNCPLPPLLS
jgi:hypothetical protein